MDLLSISKDTLDSVIKLAIEKNDDKTLQTFINNGYITLDNCIKLVTETGKMELIMILLKNDTEKPVKTDETKLKEGQETKAITNKRTISIQTTTLFDGCGGTGNATELIRDLSQNSKKALADLKSGVVSLEEINWKTSSDWTALHYTCCYMKYIMEADLIVKELLAQGAKFNDRTYGNCTALFYALYQHAPYQSMQENVVKILLDTPDIDIKMRIGADGPMNESVLVQSIKTYGHRMTDSLITLLMKHDKDFDINKLIAELNGDFDKCSHYLFIYCQCYPDSTFTMEVKKCGTLQKQEIAALMKAIGNHNNVIKRVN